MTREERWKKGKVGDKKSWDSSGKREQKMETDVENDNNE